VRALLRPIFVVEFAYVTHEDISLAGGVAYSMHRHRPTVVLPFPFVTSSPRPWSARKHPSISLSRTRVGAVRRDWFAGGAVVAFADWATVAVLVPLTSRKFPQTFSRFSYTPHSAPALSP
jgi:hypothetical protein